MVDKSMSLPPAFAGAVVAYGRFRVVAGIVTLIGGSLVALPEAGAQPQPPAEDAAAAEETPTQAVPDAAPSEAAGEPATEGEGAASGEESPDEDAGAAAEASEEAAPETEAQPEPPPVESEAEATDEADAVVVDSSASLFEEEAGDAAAPTASAPATAAPGAASGFNLGGYVRGDVFMGKVPDDSKGEIKAAYGELALKLRASGGKYGDAFAEARLRHGLQGAEQQLFTDLREAYVNLYLGPLDLRLGHQIVVWGRADGFNPTNNITPFDLRIRSPIEDDRRLANTGARASLNFAPFRIEGVWMPIYRAIEPPAFEIPNFVQFDDPQYPKPELSNGLFAGRVHLLLTSLEMSASFLSGYAPLPGLVVSGATGDPDTAPTIFIARRAYRHHVAGFDFSTAIGDLFGLRGEAAYRYPLHYAHRDYAPRPDVQYVLGADRSFGPVNIIAQYVGRYTLDWEKRERADPALIDRASELTAIDPVLLEDEMVPQAQGEIAARNQMLFMQLEQVQHLASLRVEWKTLHDTLSLVVLSLANFTTEEWLAYPKITYSISDRMKTAVGAEIYAGPDGTLFGFIGETLSAGYAELRYSF